MRIDVFKEGVRNPTYPYLVQVGALEVYKETIPVVTERGDLVGRASAMGRDEEGVVSFEIELSPRVETGPKADYSLYVRELVTLPDDLNTITYGKIFEISYIPF